MIAIILTGAAGYMVYLVFCYFPSAGSRFDPIDCRDGVGCPVPAVLLSPAEAEKRSN